MLIRRRLILKSHMAASSSGITSVEATVVAHLTVVRQKTTHLETLATHLIAAMIMVEITETITAMTAPRVAMTPITKDTVD